MYLGVICDPTIVAFISLIMGALLDLFRFDGQSTSILTTGPSLTDMTDDGESGSIVTRDTHTYVSVVT